MSKHKLWIGLVALACGAVAQTPGPSVVVTVSGSGSGAAVAASPATVVVAQSDNAVTWTMTTKGYRFAPSGGVSMPTSAGYLCANQTNNAQVVCTRTTRA
jgi:hypothetical protein